MGQTVTLNLPEQIVSAAKQVAEETHRSVQDVLVSWLERATTEPPVESLSDEQVLALADLQMKRELAEELNELLTENEQQDITEADRARLDELLTLYRKGMVRKAQALEVAVKRGLKPPLH